MAIIVITSTGTHGDHLPYIALGEALKGRGHTVRMAFRESMHSYVLKAGLEAITCGEELTVEEAQKNAAVWDFWQPKPFSVDLALDNMTYFYARDLPVIFQQLLAACKDADLLICGFQRQMFGAMLEKKLSLPWISASVTPSFQCLEAVQQPAKEEAEEEVKEDQGDNRQVIDLFVPILKDIFKQLEVPEIDWWNFGRNGRSLLGSSAHFSVPTAENAHYTQTGFWFYEDPAWKHWQPDEELRQFVEKNRPLFLTFSSIPVIDPRAVLEVHVRAAEKIGCGLVVQRGWANFNESLLPDDCDRQAVMFVDFMPQDWLLSNVSAIIHHGGVGTIARALRHNCPMLVEPLGNDQFFNAKRILALKVGTAVHPRKITPDGLAKILETKILTAETRQNTQILGEKIRTEKSLENACQAIESWL